MQNGLQTAPIHAIAFDAHVARLHRLRNAELAVDQRAKRRRIHVENGRAPRAHAIVNRHETSIADQQFPLATARAVDLNTQVGNRRPPLGQIDATVQARRRI